MRSFRLLIYLFPAVIDTVFALILFVNAVRAAKMGFRASLVAGLATVWCILYTAACPIVGRYVNSRNAGTMMTVGCLATAAVCVLFTFASTLPGMYALIAVASIGAALFFPPFQVFMKAVDTSAGKPVTYSTGVYTFAWSMGFAAGPFIAGFLMETGAAPLPGMEPDGWKYAYWAGAVAALATAFGIHFLKATVHPESPPPAAPESAPPPAGVDYSSMPDLAWLGWVGAGIGIVVLGMVRSVFPFRAVTDLHLTDSTQGTLFFLLNVAQAVTGLLLIRSRSWMYRPRAVALFGLAGLAGSVLFGLGRDGPTLALASILFGVYSGAFFFYLVFHALTHPSRSSRYVAINESVVGIGGTIGPLVGGLVSDLMGSQYPYLLGALVVAAVTIFQAAAHWRHRAATAALRTSFRHPEQRDRGA